jgi:hypothetical protein
VRACVYVLWQHATDAIGRAGLRTGSYANPRPWTYQIIDGRPHSAANIDSAARRGKGEPLFGKRAPQACRHHSVMFTTADNNRHCQ